MLASPFKYETFWPFNDTSYPCNCCCPGTAIEDNLWICKNSQEWLIVDPNHNSWANQVYEEQLLAEQAETLDQKLARLNKAAAEEAISKLSVMSFEMQNHAEMMAIKSRIGVKRNENSRKVQKPCKWLYCDEKAPKSLWRKNKEGKLCAPSTSEVRSECWAYEYVDPKTKQKKKPHTCPFLHPGEEGWCQEWFTNKFFDAQATAVQNRFISLKSRTH